MATTGPIQTRSPQGGSFGIDWEDVTKYDDFIREAADPVGWPIERVRAHIVIESQGIPTAVQENDANGWSYGLMQVVPYGVGWEGWHQLVKQKAGLPVNAPPQKVRQALMDPRINILTGVAILETFYVTHGKLDRASSAFFTGTPDWGGAGDIISGATGALYRDTLNGLIAEQNGAVQEPVAAQPTTDPLQVIFGGNPAPITFGHKEMNSVALYHYGVGHGTDSPFAHTGIDVGVRYNTPIHTPLGGKVLCVGQASSGDDMWGQGCGAFRDTGDLGPDGPNLGIGNITIMLDSGHKLTFGHCRQAFVNPGDRVEAGQQVGTSGGMFGAHTHIDVAISRPDLVSVPPGSPGSYWLNDPVPTLIEAMGGVTPPPIRKHAPRVPVPQPQEWTVSVPVRVTSDSVPVLQRASFLADHVADALVRDESFEAVMLVLGDDLNWYWVSKQGGRVPLEGTATIQGPQIATV